MTMTIYHIINVTFCEMKKTCTSIFTKSLKQENVNTIVANREIQ